MASSTVSGFLEGGGELGQLIADYDWSTTPLGPIETWPTSLTTAIALILRSPVPIVSLWGEAGTMIYNDAYSEFAGGRHPQLLGSPVREGWPEVADFNDNVMKIGLAGGTLSYEGQELTLHRSGAPEQVFMNLDYSPVIGESGKPIGVMAIVVETTRQVALQRELAHEAAQRRAEQDEQQRLFEQAPGFIVIMRGPDHRVEFVNDAHRAMFNSGDWVGRTMRDAFPSIAGQGFYEALDEVFTSGRTLEFTSTPVEFQTAPDAPKQLNYLTFIYAPLYGDDGEITGIFCEGFDVTGAHIAQRRATALANLSDRIREIADAEQLVHAAGRILGEELGTSRAGYGAIDPIAETVTISSDWMRDGLSSIAGTLSFRDFGSYIDDLLAGRPSIVTDTFTDERTRATAHMLTAIQTRSFVNMPVFEQGKLVAVFYVNDDKARSFTLDELGFLSDVAARTRTAVQRLAAEASLREKETELENRLAERTAELADAAERLNQAQKMEAIGNLTGGVAHDFNNLLSAVLGSLELLRKRMPDDPPLLRLVDNAMEGAQRGAALTRRMLAFARRQDLKAEAIDAAELVRGMEELMTRALGPTVMVETAFPEGLKRIEADPNQLESAILNLAVNARDAMQGEGRIVISGREESIGSGHAVLEPGRYVVLSVRDNGEGMDEATLSRATEPFFTTKGVGKGTGLGLSMVYGLAEQSGGTLMLKSRPGEGTTAEIWLPAISANGDIERPVVEENVVLDNPIRALKVLAVDDDALVLMNTVAMLEDLGHDVTEAYSARAALEALERTPYDLVITDHAMPQMTGSQLAVEIARRWPKTRVVLATGYAELPSGDDPGLPRLSKPFMQTDLSGVVAAVMQ